MQLDLDRYGGLEVTLQTGPRLLLGNGSDLPKKLALASAILAQIVHGERRVAAIDVRAPATPGGGVPLNGFLVSGEIHEYGDRAGDYR